MTDRLKLLARDQEDYAVFAAVLQDALITLGDMQYFAAERQFVVVANRFRWENCQDKAATGPTRISPVLAKTFSGSIAGFGSTAWTRSERAISISRSAAAFSNC